MPMGHERQQDSHSSVIADGKEGQGETAKARISSSVKTRRAIAGEKPVLPIGGSSNVNVNSLVKQLSKKIGLQQAN